MYCLTDCVSVQVGMAGASRKANFAAPTVRGAYTGLGATRTAANRPAGAELGNWSTTYTNSYEVCLCTHIVAFYCCPYNVMPLSTLFHGVCAAVKATTLLCSLRCYCFAAAAVFSNFYTLPYRMCHVGLDYISTLHAQLVWSSLLLHLVYTGLMLVNTSPGNAHCMPIMLRQTLLPDLCLLTVDAEPTRLSVLSPLTCV